MNWFKEAQPPKITILSFAGDVIKALIGDKIYMYYANPSIFKTVDFFVRKGWFGKALQVLNKLDRV